MFAPQHLAPPYDVKPHVWYAASLETMATNVYCPQVSGARQMAATARVMSRREIEKLHGIYSDANE